MQTRSPTRTSFAGTRLLNLYFSASLIVAVGAFTNQLAGADPRLQRSLSEGSPLAQVVNTTIIIIAVLVLMRSKILGSILRRAWPIFLLPALAMISALWAPDPELTLRRSIALLESALFGLSFAATYDFKSSLRLLMRMLIIVMVLSVLWAIAFPQTGVHQASDFVEPIHAGKWRGVFAHKNPLGAVAGISLALTILYGPIAFKSTTVRLAAIAVSSLCLVMASSGSGYSIAFVVIISGFIMWIIGQMPRQLRPIAIVLSFVVLACLSFFFSEIQSAALETLGKDPDLTGRTEYWGYILPFMENHWIYGHGYFSGFLEIGATIEAITKVNFGSTHSGYLDILVSFGIVGVIAAGYYFLWVFLGSLRLIMSDIDLGYAKTFPFCVVVYTLQYNLVESAALAGNSLSPLILVIAAVMIVRLDIVNKLARQRITAVQLA